ncbi:MAG: hypothetical protein II565_05785 [Fibrobacter sp.]|nr:hypothetical protein [Fibrobacter sp.]
MAKAKKASKATKVNASKATVAKTADFKTAIVKEPKAVLQAIGMDFSVAYDKAKKEVSLGDVLVAGTKKQREEFAGVLEQALVKTSEIWSGVEGKLEKYIPGQFKRIPDEKRIPIRPIIPVRNPIIPIIDPIIPIIDPIIPILIPLIPEPTPVIPDPKSPVVDKWDAMHVVGHVELVPQLEERLVQIQGIRKSLPANATKAEKKAAATAEQQVKNLIKAAKRSAPKAVKKAKAKVTKKAAVKKK